MRGGGLLCCYYSGRVGKAVAGPVGRYSNNTKENRPPSVTSAGQLS